MSARMKKLPTSNVIIIKISGKESYYTGSVSKLNQMLKKAKNLDLKPIYEDFIPWEEVARDEIKKYGKQAIALRGARHRESLTQEQLAKKLKIKQYNLSKMENGKRPIGKVMAKKFAKFFNLDYRLFL
jgi:ribosome-binding protein aMBF1 (putative translation factor)